MSEALYPGEHRCNGCGIVHNDNCGLKSQLAELKAERDALLKARSPHDEDPAIIEALAMARDAEPRAHNYQRPLLTDASLNRLIALLGGEVQP